MTTNSDPFADVRRRRNSHTRTALATSHRHLTAGLADLERVLQAFQVDELAPAGGIAGGTRNTDHGDPTGNQALRRDRGSELRARFDLAVAELNGAAVELTRIRQALLHEPTPTGLCRDGACPEGRMADRGRTGRGVARCHACYKFWGEDASNPDERLERERVGQSPRRLGLRSEVA